MLMSAMLPGLEDRGSAFGIGQRVDLGVAPAARASDRLPKGPLFPRQRAMRFDVRAVDRHRTHDVLSPVAATKTSCLTPLAAPPIEAIVEASLFAACLQDAE
jgi:hypothetical protein